MTEQKPLGSENELHKLLLDNGFSYIDYDEATFTGTLSELEAAIQAYANAARLQEAASAREVAINHRMDTPQEIINVLAARVTGLAQLTTPKGDV